jgi:hypothetical protein
MTDGYWRLDPSEKRAVSYFLGMTQAKIMCERLLLAPHLIHLDAFLAAIGKSTRVSRPDLVGLSLPAMDVTIAVEAKGRTGGRDHKVIRVAKEQARSLPGVLSTSSALRVASVASLGAKWRWQSYLEDPYGPVQALDSLTPGALLTAYYRPLVAAVLETPPEQVIDDEVTTIAELPGMDLALGVPSAIVAIVNTLPPIGPVAADQLIETGAALLQVVPNRWFTSEEEEGIYEPDTEFFLDRQDTLRPYTGRDGVYVRPGTSWLRQRR